jgi:hypothetical protein
MGSTHEYLKWGAWSVVWTYGLAVGVAEVMQGFDLNARTRS